MHTILVIAQPVSAAKPDSCDDNGVIVAALATVIVILIIVIIIYIVFVFALLRKLRSNIR